MRLIVVRHGERDGARLTPAGEEMSRETGRWLAEKGVRPTRVVVSTERRTADTARLILGEMPDLPPPERRVRAGTPSKGDAAGWKRMLAELLDGATGDVLAVVHGAPQHFVETLHGGAALGVPKENRAAAFVLERDERGEWRCTDGWRGAAKRR